MTKRVTVSLPDHVAERLEREPNASAYVAEAIEGRMRGERIRQQLADAGVVITDAGVARARQRLAELDEVWSPERRRVLREQRRERTREQLPDLR